MMSFDIDVDTGNVSIDGKSLRNEEMKELDFTSSAFYNNLSGKGLIKKLIPHHYVINEISWGKEAFELIIRPQCFDNFPFLLQFLGKDWEYFHCLDNWDKKTNISMLDRQVVVMSNWLTENISLPSDVEVIENGNRWNFSWGRISASYETKSFNCGIYISYL
ncbi:hypothetical protein [Erwinia sp. 9145]|uniref:hypothetical protein n=1 Tax=Erwinia sp. 9145 TaxID=1500895 RepID=UPI000558A5A5|nr:hypothetical protein [Erwinia sp. 9145]